ncbi:MAG TPA: tRNA uridine-5-carboxymethylaminomethyl(34) synthesis GTPase MnmE [Thermoanaerobaculia bacterium]|jgi:tRNA modification GTPase|nr:tRNA uridine-5-carboxymethylaminomethyl(34) synthesis GTPase MnmE [Thermoanaerobaculia bacterium]
MRPSSESLLDTIAALATPLGRSAIALVRLSGDRTREILARVAPGLPRDPDPRRPHLVSLQDGESEPIDRGLVTLFAAPASFTGEDVAEISVHGSPVVAERLLRALIAAGARPARPGEFTERAFRLGKMDLVRAEAIRDLIDSRTAACAQASANRVEGALSSRLARTREDLLAAAASLAATVDFAEDVGEDVDPRVSALLSGARDALARLAATYDTGRLLSAGCRVAILGRPNAGKSTLFNALLGTERAIVTDVPGTTRDTLEATLDVCGIPVELVDTAGLREAQEEVERIGVARARDEGGKAAAILYVYDASIGWAAEDRDALGSLNGKPIAIVANKVDRIAEGALGAREGGPPDWTVAGADPFGIRPRGDWTAAGADPFGICPRGDFLALCGLSPDAGPKLRELLERTVSSDLTSDSASEVLGSVRQRDLVARAGAAAGEALDALARGDSPEYAATHVDSALAALADVFGETTSEDVLARIFSTFCIGK